MLLAGYDDLGGQSGDFGKAYGSGVTQGQSKASGVGSRECKLYIGTDYNHNHNHVFFYPK